MLIIVGAGLAGLSAAYRLIVEAKIAAEQILILEAKDRIGGRIESFAFPDGTEVDLGAQWLHGEKNNPIYEWLNTLGLIRGPEEEKSEYEGIFSCPTGRLPPIDIVPRVLDLLMDTKDFLYKASHAFDRSAKPIEIFRKHIKMEIDKSPELRCVDKGLIEAVQRWFELYEMIDNSCEDMSLLSMKAYSDWTNFDEGKMTLLKGGWSSVVNKLVNLIGMDRIRLRHRVKRMRYDQQGVQLTVLDGRDCFIELTSKHVIVTCSVGFLKTQARDLFVPPISESRLLQLENCGFGVVNKIFLQFEQPFLQEEKGLKIIWPVQDDNTPQSTLPEWTKFITGFDIVNSSPNVLLGWIGGRGAEMIELLSDHTIARACLAIFKIFLPTKKVPRLTAMKRSSWASNLYIRGAYSYPSIKSTEDTSDLWEPLCSTEIVHDETGNEVFKMSPKVLFAGEATAKNMYATGHGAILSGWREADRLAKIYQT